MSKQKSLCVINITPIDFLLSLQGITAHRRTLLKRVHKSWVLPISDPPQVLFKHFGGSLIAATQNAFVHTLSKRVHNCSAWTLSDLSRTLFECFESSLTAAAHAETVVALATYSLTSVR